MHEGLLLVLGVHIEDAEMFRMALLERPPHKPVLGDGGGGPGEGPGGAGEGPLPKTPATAFGLGSFDGQPVLK